LPVEKFPGERQLGAVPVAPGRTAFTVWAPNARSVAVRTGGSDHALEREGELSTRTVAAAPGDDYLLVVDGEPLADPCSRSQPQGLDGPSRVVDTAAFGGRRLGLDADDLVIYELHVGTFSPEGTFDGATPRLGELADLGVTAVEVMPIATFPGNRNWGYDGVFGFAPHPAYGGPDGFARFVDAAHGAGLGVILDVVYNHVGPGHRLDAFGPYFTDRHETAWGEALDFTRRPVREWAIQNAELWVRDYGVDGLRLDAVHAIVDDSPTHVLAELRERVKAVDPGVLVISEAATGDLRPIEEWGHDAQWADELHHELHVLVTGEREGYYAGYGSADGLARQLERRPSERLVVCSQNHDQVGNRARGDRPSPDELRVRAATVLFAPQVPLLFMGEEYGEQRPFQFFTDHTDPFVADATREGRRREFARFADFSAEDVPDPQDPETFERSKLDPARGDPELRQLYADLLSLRRELPREVECEVEGPLLRVRRGRHELEIDVERRSVEVRVAA
jgi:maltooligosyltrehalose trehalohydrolase